MSSKAPIEEEDNDADEQRVEVTNCPSLRFGAV